ncbi:MAG: hypothetical protein HZY76_04865 [Anaerolineae bacterium]|nr:MAG: hypothetical protein HZY76_04865 [Anaerolineae bacterium]
MAIDHCQRSVPGRIFVLAYRYAGGAGALVGMLLLAVAPYQVWYAGGPVLRLVDPAGAAGDLRARARLDEPPRNRYWLVFGLANVANLYNQPLPAVLLLLGQSVLIGIWLLLSPSHRPIIGKALVMYVLIAAAYWPVIQRVIITGRMDAFNSETFLAYQDFAFWLALADTVHITVDQFAAGGVTAWVYLTLFLGGLLAVARQRQWKLFALALAPPLAAVLLFAIARPRTGSSSVMRCMRSRSTTWGSRPVFGRWPAGRAPPSTVWRFAVALRHPAPPA